MIVRNPKWPDGSIASTKLNYNLVIISVLSGLSSNGLYCSEIHESILEWIRIQVILTAEFLR